MDQRYQLSDGKSGCRSTSSDSSILTVTEQGTYEPYYAYVTVECANKYIVLSGNSTNL